VPGHLDVNGSVGLLFTSFDVSGEPEAVARHLSAVARSLTRIEPATVEHEIRVLAAEERQRASGPLQQALVWRFGMRGPGMADAGQVGLA
jgi:hypothetical protein